jgi:hypothetical protein
MSLTSTFTTRAGDVTVTLDMTPVGTFDIIDMGRIEYDFDLTNYGEAVNKVGVMYNRSSMSVYRYTTEAKDFYDLMYDHLYSFPGTPIPVTVSIALHSGNTAEFRFRIRKQSLSRKVNENVMKIDLDPLDEPTTTVGDVIDAIALFQGFDTATISTTSIGVLVGDFIEYTASGLNPSLPTIVESAYQNTAGFPAVTFPTISTISDLVDGVEYMFVADNTADSESATNAVRNYAVLEGGIFGTGFDYNFYVHRMRTDRAVVLYDTDLESCESETIQTPYASIALTMQDWSTDPYNNIATKTVFESTGVQAEKSVSGIFPFIGVGKGVWVAPPTAQMDTGLASADTSETLTLSSGILAHKTALNAAPSPIFKIKATILGVDTFKPYQTITLSGTSFPRDFRFSPASLRRYYRPTFIAYDLENDKVEVRLYAIV